MFYQLKILDNLDDNLCFQSNEDVLTSKAAVLTLKACVFALKATVLMSKAVVLMPKAHEFTLHAVVAGAKATIITPNADENGTDIRYIQQLLGHSSIKTTEIYTHITDISKSKIKSPLEFL